MSEGGGGEELEGPPKVLVDGMNSFNIVFIVHTLNSIDITPI